MKGGKVVKRKLKYISISILLLVIGLVLFNKYIELKNVVFDGDGIGIYLLDFIEINDKVPNEQVATYANGFFNRFRFIFYRDSIYFAQIIP